MPESLDAIRQSLMLSPAILVDFVREIPREALTVRRRADFWSIQDHVAHLADVQPMLCGRLIRFRDEERPQFKPFLPEAAEPTIPKPLISDVETALSEFASWRAKQLALIDELPSTIWTKEAEHPEYLRYTALGLLRHLLMHDHWHMYRIEELWLTRDEYLTELH